MPESPVPESPGPESIVDLELTDADPAAVALAAYGLKVPPDELAELSAQYPAIRASLELLYDPAFGDADPLVFPLLEPFAAPELQEAS
jgi:hypothetical protein